jgi:hypothetical protein
LNGDSKSDLSKISQRRDQKDESSK